MREIAAAVRAREAVVHEVEMEMIFGGSRSPRDAYGKVRKRRDNPQPKGDPQSAPPPPPRQDEEGFEGGAFGDIPEFEQEMLFEDILRVVMGMNPDRMNERKYEQMFADFMANVLGQKRPEPQPARAPPQSGQGRLKKLYRLPARRLHPGTKADNDTAVSAIWHEVQGAYRDGNVERLEMLLAMTDLQANPTGEHTSLLQMRSVLAELRRTPGHPRRSIRCHRRYPVPCVTWSRSSRWQDRHRPAR